MIECRTVENRQRTYLPINLQMKSHICSLFMRKLEEKIARSNDGIFIVYASSEKKRKCQIIKQWKHGCNKKIYKRQMRIGHATNSTVHAMQIKRSHQCAHDTVYRLFLRQSNVRNYFLSVVIYDQNTPINLNQSTLWQDAGTNVQSCNMFVSIFPIHTRCLCSW